MGKIPLSCRRIHRWACSRYAVSSYWLMLAKEKPRDLRGLEDHQYTLTIF